MVSLSQSNQPLYMLWRGEVECYYSTSEQNILKHLDFCGHDSKAMEKLKIKFKFLSYQLYYLPLSIFFTLPDKLP